MSWEGASGDAFYCARWNDCLPMEGLMDEMIRGRGVEVGRFL
jgi:hypothetical protein